MSRIGKKPIPIPEQVTISMVDHSVFVEGPKGKLFFELHPAVALTIDGKELKVVPRGASRKTSALWGLSRSLLANMVEGVCNGFEKKLEIEGIGYRASMEGNNLMLLLGFSHPIPFSAPEGIQFHVERNVITVSGIDKGLVGRVAGQIRSIKPPEPYKGKGIRYRGELVRRKAGKKSGTS